MSQEINGIEKQNKLEITELKLQNKIMENTVLQLKNKDLEKRTYQMKMEMCNMRQELITMRNDRSPAVRRFPWLAGPCFASLPPEIEGYILGFLNDDELFSLRSLNTTFYAAYYNQSIPADCFHEIKDGKLQINFERAINLGMHKRVFKNFRCLVIDEHLKEFADLKDVPHAFPNITMLEIVINITFIFRSLSVTMQKLMSKLPTLPKITEICHRSDLLSISEFYCFKEGYSKFPNVAKMAFNDSAGFDRIDRCPVVDTLTFFKGVYNLESLQHISFANFPKLSRVVFYCIDAMHRDIGVGPIGTEFARLKKDGIVVELKEL